jgi:ATP-dependent DNA helicase RecQ
LRPFAGVESNFGAVDGMLFGRDKQAENSYAEPDAMEISAIQGPELRRELLSPFYRNALLLDLETSMQGAILKLGAALGDRTFVRTKQSAESLLELGSMAAGATCVLGHNLVRHDLEVIRQISPAHPLLRLPVIDTLLLSPIAFPENPYHRLVKDYKLVRESLNDPVADARQAAYLFEDELRSLAGLRQTEPGLCELLHFLLATPEFGHDPLAQGMDLVFATLGNARPTAERALVLTRDLIRKWACSGFPVSAALVQTRAQRLALAYAVTWLRVAGSNSVLPPWVRMEHPATIGLIQQMREVPCKAPDCVYCRRVHNPKAQLKGFFGFDDFRPIPRNAAGGSLQQDIIEAGMRNESLLAILPTGGGKSLCYQLPALVRNYRRGVLTLIISPLQALMKDQVDGLVRRTGTPFAAALYGLLTPPERGDVLRRVRTGDVALLYVSPEQLRNRSFRDAIALREIGCWVFDEAHCLSKWGHDFRPDYLYAGRFIREFAQSQGSSIPAIACFTATAKRDVREEIIAYFKAETGRDLQLFEGGVERDNLIFGVQSIGGHGKLERVHDLLADRLPPGNAGCAIVFRATRYATELTAEYLRAKGWTAERFHAGLTPPEKKRIQDEFLAGNLRVICATNAFGMGIDKEDVRLVIHADTPGSLENYLQEAGRAGRDGNSAECVLLFTEEDCEHQFRMGAFSELSRRDIAQILRSLRKSARGSQDKVVITAGEILRDEDIETGIDLQDRTADTKVRTAISWLERSGFLQRDENVTSVFQARPLVKDLQEAGERMRGLNLSAAEQGLWLAILREVINTKTTESLTVDRLALLPEFTNYAKGNPAALANPEYVSAKVLKILGSMAQAGLMKRDMLLNAFVRHKVADHSRLRLDRVLALDRRLVDALAIEQPDPEGWMPLSLRLVNQRLLDEGGHSSPELVRSLLRSLSEDGRGFAGSQGSIDLRYLGRDSYRIRVRRSWSAITELAEKRRRVAAVVLDTLLGKIPADASPRADLLVEFSFDELHQAVEHDLVLRSEVKDIDSAVERALMFLHEQRVIVLQQGLAVFRAAMTIRLRPEAKGEKYKASDYQPLEHHYHERILQVHVMGEYARLGLGRMQEALELVLAYFTLDKEQFTRRYLGSKPDLLKHATTAQSYQRIVTDLENAAQIKVVTAPVSRNMLILAGPGSGKTRTVVHRCAYLLRIERVRPQSILVCCFNRSAALELRRRLVDLVGHDARGVTVLTYHGLAMRLLGHSFSGRNGSGDREIDFNALIGDAVKLLRGQDVPAGLESDEVRDRLLAGFQHILVDEYQDIDEPQYQMISAIAGRALEDPDQKLSIMAVGDDDQNIYDFRGTNVEFIRRFQQDYEAEVHYLVENYRSTRHIIDAANQLIAANADRMKTDRPIRIDRQRAASPAGERVQVIGVADEVAQAQAVLAEVERLRAVGTTDLSHIAVLSASHRELAHVRSLAEQAGTPVRWFASRTSMPPLHQLRESRWLLRHLAEKRTALLRAVDIIHCAQELFKDRPATPWTAYLNRVLAAWQAESDDAEMPVQEFIEFLYETSAEDRRDFSYGEGILLSTVHSAKGTEHDHVLLIGAWPQVPLRAKTEEGRRAFYVGMTRARKTLMVFNRNDVRPSLCDSLVGPAVLRREFPEESKASNGLVTYAMLSLEDLHLGYPAQFDSDHPVHQALARLNPGDWLEPQALRDGGVGLHDGSGICVARLSRKGAATWLPKLPNIRELRIVAMLNRTAEQAEKEYQDRCRVREWELPVVEVVLGASVDELKLS